MSETKQHYLELGIEFCLELAIGLYPLGAEQMDLPHNFWIGLGLWGVATVLAIRIFWIFPWVERWPSRIKSLVAAVGVMVFVAFAWSPVQHAYNKKNVQSDEPVGQQSSSVQQSNKGNNNTNINGNNNTVKNTVVINRNDPKAKVQLDRIENLLRDQQDQLTPKKLLAKYPLGYVIFEADYSQQVFPYHSEALEGWSFDWTVVKLIDHGSELELRLPNIRPSSNPKGMIMVNSSMGLYKVVGPLDIILMKYDHVVLQGEILAITNDGVVFLFGFSKQHPVRQQ